MSKLPTVSIIIVNYNGKQLLKDCLKSLNKINYPQKNYQIIVVDNNSSDGSPTFLEKNYPQIKLISSDKNLGFGQANNLAAKQARGEYLVFLNNDTQVKKDWLINLVKTISSDKNIGAVTSKALFLDKPDTIQSAGVSIFKNAKGRERGAVVKDGQTIYPKDNKTFNQTTEVDAISGVSFIIPKKLFLKLGGFDPLFFMYYEDADLSFRLKKLSYKLIYEPKSSLLHHHAASSKEWSDFFIYHAEKGHLVFLIRHFPLPVIIIQIVYYLFLTLLSLLRMIKKLLQRDKENFIIWQNRFKLRLRVIWWIINHLKAIRIWQK